MKESDIEGLATRGGPEPCAGDRKAEGEALVGGVQAGLWSRENNRIGVPTQSENAEGHIAGGARSEPTGDPARSENQGMYASSMRENRESPPVARPLIRAGSLGEG
jgi:hypothetical protein